ncbi:MAG: NADP(H)-dependent aldo-keto reductase [Agarilytica sp.]
MKFNKLGNTDIDVSLICLGSMTWGEQNTQEEAFAQMDMAVDMGVNFFDVAEMYPVPPRPETQGLTESYMGAWLAERGMRDKIVLATKVTGRSSRNSGLGHIRDGARLSKAHIDQAIDDSLRRLKTDYVDLYQVHWPERATNFFGRLEYQHGEDDGIEIEESLSALSDLVKSGKVRHIGISNETPWGIHEYLRLSDKLDLPRIVSVQNPYNLLNRTFDIGAGEMAIREKVGLLAYSPLAFGALSGKYLNGQRPAGARLTLFERFQRYLNEGSERATKAYAELANSVGLNPAQMALAFVNQRQAVTSNIIGATNLAQLKDNIESIDLVLSEDVLTKIDDIHIQNPNPAP